MTTLLLFHVGGAMVTGVTIIAVIISLTKNSSKDSLLGQAKMLGALTVMQYITGIALMVSTQDSTVRGCISLGVYTAAIIAVELAIAYRIKETAKNGQTLPIGSLNN